MLPCGSGGNAGAPGLLRQEMSFACHTSDECAVACKKGAVRLRSCPPSLLRSSPTAETPPSPPDLLILQGEAALWLVSGSHYPHPSLLQLSFQFHSIVVFFNLFYLALTVLYFFFYPHIPTERGIPDTVIFFLFLHHFWYTVSFFSTFLTLRSRRCDHVL